MWLVLIGVWFALSLWVFRDPPGKPGSGSPDRFWLSRPGAMIPSLLLPGLIVGRWWLVPIAAVAWPVLLMVDGIGAGWRFGVSAGAVAAANVAFAVALHRGTASLIRRLARFLHDPIGAAGGRASGRRQH